LGSENGCDCTKQRLDLPQLQSSSKSRAKNQRIPDRKTTYILALDMQKIIGIRTGCPNRDVRTTAVVLS
jgi:hypothetical protein